MKKKKFMYLIGIFCLILLFILLINLGKSFAATESSYTKKQLQDYVVSTALSYYYNNNYTDYEGYWADEFRSSHSTMYNVDPEMLSRSKYMTTQCAGFSAAVYMHSLGYDLNVIKEGYKEDDRYTFYRDEDRNIIFGKTSNETFKNLYTYFNKGYSVAYFNKIAVNNSNKIDPDMVIATFNKEEGVVKGFTQGKYDTSKNVGSLSNINELIEEVKNLLEPGDILLNDGHAMIWVGDALEPAGGAIHSSGVSYKNEKDEQGFTRSSGYDSYSVRYSSANFIYEDQIKYHSGAENTIVTILRPINALCYFDANDNCILKNDSINIKDNLEARSKFKNLQVEQYAYDVTSNRTIGVDSITLNSGDKISYRLELTNKSKMSFCASGKETTKEECEATGYTWNTSKNEMNYKNLTIKAEVPENTTYVSCSNNCTHEVIDGKTIVYWKNVDIDIPSELDDSGSLIEETKKFNYTVRINNNLNDVEIQNKGMQIEYDNSILKMSKITIGVNPSISGQYSTLLQNQLTEDLNNSDLNVYNGDIANFSSFYYRTLKSLIPSNKQTLYEIIYRDDSSVDENEPVNKLINSLFNKNIDQSDSSFVSYTRKLPSEVDSLTGKKQVINQMLVPGFYGGRKYEVLYYENNMDDFYRIKPIWSTPRIDLNVGDVIVLIPDITNVKKIEAFMYVGTEQSIPSIIYFENGAIKKLNKDTNYNNAGYTLYSNKYFLSKIYSSDLYFALRPSLYYEPVITYNLILNSGIGNDIQELTVSYGKNLENIIPPKMTGYTFKGYYTEENCGGTKYYNEDGTSINNLNINSDTELYACYDVNKVQVKFHVNGGILSSTNSSYTQIGDFVARNGEVEPSVWEYDYTNTDIDLYNPDSLSYINIIKEGYSPKNGAEWITEDGVEISDSGGVKASDLCDASEGDCTVVLKVNWELNKYTITFNTNGGNMSVTEMIVNHGESLDTIEIPQKVGYSFDGWYIDNDLTTKFDTKSKITGNMILYAMWRPITYQIKYNANGGVGTMSNSEHDYNIEKPLSKNAYTKEGYIFAGWSLSAEGELVCQDEQSVKNLTSENNKVINLYAKWTPITYEIKYDANGGVGTMENSLHTYGEEKELSINKFTKEGYIFAGWSTTTNGEVVYQDEQNVKNLTSENNKVINLYAMWTPITYEVKYDANGGVGIMENSLHIYGEEKNLSINKFTKEGYNFAGWSTSKGTTIDFLNEDGVINLSTKNNDVVTLYAVWKDETVKEYTIKVEIENGTINETSKAVEQNSDALFTVNANKGYSSPIVSCNNDQTSIIEGNTLKVENVTNDTTCNVIYKANTYQVKYNANGGTGTMENSTHTYDISKELTTKAFTRTGYTFEGWSKTQTGSAEYIDKETVRNLTEENNGIVNLYAVWKPVTYKIKYNLDGGNAVNPETYTIETPTFKLNNPTKEGHKFIGWTTPNDSNKKLEVEIVKGTTGDKEYTANYEITKYSVVYKSDENGSITGKTVEEIQYQNNPTGTTQDAKEGYKDLKWAVDKDVELKDGTIINKGESITEEQIKNIVIKEDITITIYHYQIKYNVSYESSENGEVDRTSEEVAQNANPLGVKISPNKGYKLSHFIADKDVELKDGTVIKQGEEITEEELLEIVIKEDIKLKAMYEIAKYTVRYESDENGSIKDVISEEILYQNSPLGTIVIPNKNYEVLNWVSDKDVELKDGTIIKAGEEITGEELKEIKVESDLVLTVKYIKTVHTVYYKSDSTINITGILKEEVRNLNSPQGTEIEAQDVNSYIIWIANKDVELKDGTIIKAGEEITAKELSKILVKEDLILTAYAKNNVKVEVPNTGSVRSIVAIGLGITLVAGGIYFVHKRKKEIN